MYRIKVYAPNATRQKYLESSKTSHPLVGKLVKTLLKKHNDYKANVLEPNPHSFIHFMEQDIYILTGVSYTPFFARFGNYINRNYKNYKSIK